MRAIAAKRRDFEFLLRRRTARKVNLTPKRCRLPCASLRLWLHRTQPNSTDQTHSTPNPPTKPTPKSTNQRPNKQHQADFLRYLEYEINLDELRRLRKAKLGLTKSTRADFSGRQLVHFIFERALRKFRCGSGVGRVVCCGSVVRVMMVVMMTRHKQI